MEAPLSENRRKCRRQTQHDPASTIIHRPADEFTSVPKTPHAPESDRQLLTNKSRFDWDVFVDEQGRRSYMDMKEYSLGETTGGGENEVPVEERISG